MNHENRNLPTASNATHSTVACRGAFVAYIQALPSPNVGVPAATWVLGVRVCQPLK